MMPRGCERCGAARYAQIPVESIPDMKYLAAKESVAQLVVLAPRGVDAGSRPVRLPSVDIEI